MAFTLIQFIVFLLAAVVLYYLVPKRMQWVVLLAASYVFYLWGGVWVAAYIGFTTLTTYLGGRWLSRLGRAKLPAEKRKKKGILAAVLVLNFVLLYMAKYWDFTAELAGLPTLSLLMPMGLSFYIFQSAGYVVDCYRGKYEAQKNLFRYALFVSFFPQLIQGPISRYDALGEQLYAPHPFDADQIKYGIQRILWGYLKKMVIADRAAVLVHTVFGDYENYGGAVTALAVLFYCIQLYCDFSGGIDITIGAAELLGIRLAENFERPIFSTSLADYWRRWHITLGSWMKDYLFYPMSLSKPFIRLGKWTRRRIGGKLGKIIPTSLATFVIYFVIGIWHGANFRYIAYGFYNGILITASVLLVHLFFRIKKALRIRDESKIYRAFCMARTWGIVFIGRYITRAPRLTAAAWMIRNTFLNPNVGELFGGTVLELGLKGADFWIIAVGTAVMLAVEYLQERGIRIRASLEKKHAFLQWLVLFLMLLALALFGIYREGHISSEFIYKQF